ncbi:carbohydrate ABC transporter permease [Halothermothrix orenii]|uniref:Binding-protein-dependent transport systems inner membrane component n=1 Tax=Halothermothrix orenii (strain H 168 / OCM 544 / DSM 9562) TaxID=373903 RepID=B8CZT9_HALOH|nr:sugar ABC transporter permease [Halothermothrix orenii]ACL70791.1 binding-protein-dependent transport systems inner membrane component [Halothermothrix orenii H 168]
MRLSNKTNRTFEGGIANLSRKFHQQWFAYVLILPAILIMILVVFYPFVFNFRLSFMNVKMYNMRFFIKEGFSSDRLKLLGFGNYIKLLKEPFFWEVFLKTVMWTFVNVFCHVVGGIFLAILLNRQLRFKKLYRTLLIIPWAIPEFINALVWRGMFNYRYGAVNIVLDRLFDMSPLPWLSHHIWGWGAVMITNIWLGIPFMMIVALGGLQSIPKTYYEAARIDGASGWQQIRHITLPMLKPVMTPAIVLGTVWTFNKITVIYLIAGRNLTRKVEILVSYVYRSAFELYQYSYAAALSVIIFVILLVFSIVFIKYIRGTEGVQ